MSRTLTRAAALALALALVAVSLPNRAQADPSQLCRGFANIALAPLDVVFGPFIAGKDIYYGLTEIDDPTSTKIVGFVPGYLLLNGMQAGGALFRVIVGAFEIPLGMITFFREDAEPPLFRNQDETYALYSEDFGPCPVRIGSSYNTINEF